MYVALCSAELRWLLLKGTIVQSSLVFKDDDYYVFEEWHWSLGNVYMDIDQKKKVPAVYLWLTEKATVAVRDIKSVELRRNNGFAEILEKMDGLFLKDCYTTSLCCIQRML